MNGLLEGKVAIVTGAARGIGLAVATRFAAEGATVLLADVDRAAVAAAADSVTGARAVGCDVTDEHQVAELVATAMRDNSRLDVMVNNAGIAVANTVVGTDLAEWRRVLSINLDGVFLGIKHATPAMAQNGGGSIVNVASIKAFGGQPGAASYSASKAAVVSLTKSAALELRSLNVRVNALCPGWIGTDLVASNAEPMKNLTGVDLEEYINHIQGRLGEPSEIAAVAAFLASDRSRLINAAAIVADGGATASLI